MTNRMRPGPVTQDMARGGFSGDETDGHYIEIDGPGSEYELLEVLERLIGPESIDRTEHCPPVVALPGGRTIVFVDMAPDPDGPALLAIGNLDHDHEARGRVAETICRALSLQTPWRLMCSADGGGGAGMRWPC